MLPELNKITYFAIVLIVIIPVLSWLWGCVSIYYYKKAIDIMKESYSLLEQTKKLNEQMLNYRIETMEIRSQAEEEMKLACRYYAKITELVTREPENKRVGQL